MAAGACAGAGCSHWRLQDEAERWLPGPPAGELGPVADVQLLESGPLRRGLLLQQEVLQGRQLQVQLQAQCAELQVQAEAAQLRLQQALQRQQVGALL